VTPGIDVLDSIVICDIIGDQQAPTVAYGDTVFLVSWLDKRGTFPAIYSARVRRDGSVIEQNGFPLHADSMSQISPVSAYDGTNFLVVWIGFDAGGFGVYAKRISPAGTILDSLPIVLCYDPAPKYNPAISFGESDYMVIWDDARLTGSEYDEWAARISTEGVLLDTNGIPVDTSPGYQYNPSIAFRDPYYLAVWTDEQSGEADMVGKRIQMDGVVIEHVSIPISTAAGGQMDAAVCSGDEHYCVGWQDGRAGYENMDIYGVLVDSAGAGVKDAGQRGSEVNAALTAIPNPFRDQVAILWTGGADAATVKVQVFDVRGRMVKQQSVRAGDKGSQQSFLWNARDDQGQEVSAGIYFVVVGEGAMQQRKKLLLLR
jgi:hypothetical protein